MHSFEKFLEAHNIDVQAIGELESVSRMQFLKLRVGLYGQTNIDTIYAIAALAGCQAGEVAEALLDYQPKKDYGQNDAPF